MLRNRRLTRHIAGVGMGELRRQLDYKTTWRAPSSKTCSTCGAVKTTLRLSERTFRCEHLVLDRDLNAARNLARLVDGVVVARPPRVCGATVNEPDGNPQETRTPAGSGYRHGKAHTNRCGSRSARQRASSGHAFTSFLNG
jgi:putative transposase